MPKQRIDDYRDIAQRHTGDKRNFVEFDIAQRCGGCGDPKLQPATDEAEESEAGFLDKLGDALYESTGVRLAGAALITYAAVSVASRLFPARNLVPVP